MGARSAAVDRGIPGDGVARPVTRGTDHGGRVHRGQDGGSSMPHVSANGLSFHYLQAGAGPNLVMIHGLTGNQAVWHLRMVPLLRNQFRITCYDLRGHGRSDMPPTGYTTGYMAEDLRGIMDALGLQRAHVMGHSLGADIALHFALLYPDR